MRSQTLPAWHHHKVKGKWKLLPAKIDWKRRIEFYKPRKNQKVVLNKYQLDPFVILNEIPGAGKSLTMSFILAHHLVRKKALKALICVPQTPISKSFLPKKGWQKCLCHLDGTKTYWDPMRNFCSDSVVTVGKKEELLEFLEQPVSNLESNHRIAIVTHNILRDIYTDSKLGDQELRKLFEDVFLVIDEAHHVQISENGASNILGGLVDVLLKKLPKNFRLWFLTASYFRGDVLEILPEKYLAMFKRHYVPFDEHWNKYIEFITTCSFDFVFYHDMFASFKKMLRKNGRKKTLVFIPYMGVNKYRIYERMAAIVREVYGKEARISDLVDEEDRKRKKLAVIYGEKFDVIFAVRLFDEGTDWDECEQIFDFNPSNSLRVQYQRFGRMWRDLPGKTSVGYYIFLQRVVKDIEKQRERLSVYFGILSMALTLGEDVRPVPLQKQKNKKVANGHHTEIDLQEQSDLTNHMLEWFGKNKNPNISDEDFRKQAEQFASEMNIPEHNRQYIVGKTLAILRKLSKQFPTSKPSNPSSYQPTNQLIKEVVKDGKYDKVQVINVAGLRQYFTLFGVQAFGVNTLKEFRTIIEQNKRTWNDMLDRVKAHIEKNGTLSVLQFRGDNPWEKSKDPEERRLNRWVRVQKLKWHQNDLTPEQRKRLSSIPIILEYVTTDPWDKNNKKAEEYWEKYKQLPPNNGTTKRIRGWINAQLAYDVSGYLSPDRRKKLSWLLELNLRRKRLDVKNLHRMIKAYYRQTGKYPDTGSSTDKIKAASIFFSKSDFFFKFKSRWTSWRAVNTTLRNGYRGLPKSSLAEQVAIVSKKPQVKFLLNIEDVRQMIKDYHDKTGKRPTGRNEKITGINNPGNWRTWACLNNVLSGGGRGLPKSSLWKESKLALGVQNRIASNKVVKMSQIQQMIIDHHSKTGKYPNQATGKIVGINNPGNWRTWASLATVLHGGCNGLHKTTLIKQVKLISTGSRGRRSHKVLRAMK